MAEIDDMGGDVAILPDSKTRLEKPKLFKVLLHNDDYTTMDFVVFILEHVFARTTAESAAIMLKVHKEGVGIAGIYPYEIATMKRDKATNIARSREFPLLVTLEEE